MQHPFSAFIARTRVERSFRSCGILKRASKRRSTHGVGRHLVSATALPAWTNQLLSLPQCLVFNRQGARSSNASRRLMVHAQQQDDHSQQDWLQVRSVHAACPCGTPAAPAWQLASNPHLQHLITTYRAVTTAAAAQTMSSQAACASMRRYERVASRERAWEAQAMLPRRCPPSPLQPSAPAPVLAPPRPRPAAGGRLARVPRPTGGHGAGAGGPGGPDAPAAGRAVGAHHHRAGARRAAGGQEAQPGHVHAGAPRAAAAAVELVPPRRAVS